MVMDSSIYGVAVIDGSLYSRFYSTIIRWSRGPIWHMTPWKCLQLRCSQNLSEATKNCF